MAPHPPPHLIPITLLRANPGGGLMMHPFTRGVLLVGLCLLSQQARADSLTTPTQDARKLELLRSSDSTKAPQCVVQGDDQSRCVWQQLSSALIALANSETQSDPDAIILNLTHHLPQSYAWLGGLAEKSGKNTDPAWDLPFLTATLLHRALAQFGPSSSAPKKLREDTANAIRSLLGTWAKTECRLNDANVHRVWSPEATENHDAQRAYACWAAAMVTATGQAGNSAPYADASTPAEQRDAWTAYFKEMIRQRASHGISIEFFSPTYSKYFLSVFYNIYDFTSDSELKILSRNFITLWWSVWAQEQIDGVHGGGKSRFYYNINPNDTPLLGIPWIYFGIGPQKGADQIPHLPIILSTYSPPDTLKCEVRKVGERAPFESTTFDIGLREKRPKGQPNIILPTLNALKRYTFRGRGYVMGSVAVPRLNGDRWADISSQNRWSGVVMAGSLDARAFAAPERGDQKSNYNATTAVQRRGTMIIQKLRPPMSRGAGPMRIFVGRALKVQEDSGWIFAEGSAYLAIRPASGSYVRTGDENPTYQLTDDYAPVILQAGDKSDFPNLRAFRDAVVGQPLITSSSSTSFTPPGEHTPLVMETPVGPAPIDQERFFNLEGQLLYKGPFVESRIGTATTRITCDNQTLDLQFDRK